LLKQYLNNIVATAAFIISTASLLVAYMQADAAYKQVEVMTIPNLFASHGNYDDDEKVPAISITVSNAGLGPALIKHAAIVYNGDEYTSYNEFIDECCTDVDKETRSGFNMITAGMKNAFIAGQADKKLVYLTKKDNPAVFEKLNDVRWDLKLNVCYCSLLEDCFMLRGELTIDVPSCPSASRSL